MATTTRKPYTVARRCFATVTPRIPERVSPEMAQLLTKFSAKPPQPLTLSRLLSFARPPSADSVIASAQYTLSEVPRRLASRIRAIESLPFIVGTNPHVARSLNTHRASFAALSSFPGVKTLADNWHLTQRLEKLVEQHAEDIPTMAKGFQECLRYMSADDIAAFLDDLIRSRIAVRLIGEQHIALSHTLRHPAEPVAQVIDPACSPAAMARTCGDFVGSLCDATLGARPALTIDGHSDATFAHVPVHLEYVLTELLKNSFRATVEHHRSQGGRGELSPVRVTIASPPLRTNAGSSSLLSIRIRDEGGGIAPEHLPRVFSYAFTTAGAAAATASSRSSFDVGSEGGPYAAQNVSGIGAAGEVDVFDTIARSGLQTGLGTIAGLGYGLPMSRIYARYFGGALDLVSLDGWGTDVFVKLRCLDEEAGDAEI